MLIVRRVDFIVLTLLMAVSFVLRYHSLTEFSLTNDEMSSWVRSSYPSYHLVWDKGILTDGHPPFTYLFLHTWLHFFGDSVLALRLPFVLASTLSILVLYMLGATWFSRAAALCAAAVVGVGQYFIFWGTVARPYAFGLLFLLLTMYFGDSWRTKTGRNLAPGRIAFVLCGALACLTHYFSFLAIVVYSGILFIYAPKQNKGSLAVAGLLITALLLTCTHVFVTQIGLGGLEWLGKPDNNYLQLILTEAFNKDDFWWILIILIVVYALTVQKNGFDFGRVVCLACFIISFTVGYFKSIYGAAVLQGICMYFTLPLFMLLIFSAVPAIVTFKHFHWPASLLALCILSYGCYSTVHRNRFYETEHSSGFKKLVLEIDTLAQRYSLDSTVCIGNFNNARYIQYYIERFNRPVPFIIYRCDNGEGLARLAKVLDSLPGKKYCLYTWSSVYLPPQTDSIIRHRFPRRLYKSYHLNADVRLYER